MTARRRTAGRELFVLREGGAIGPTVYGQSRDGNGYAHAMEHTVLVRPNGVAAVPGER